MGLEKLIPVSITIILLILALVVGIYIARGLKSWGSRSEMKEAGFTLQDLREMLSRGEITQREFESMRAQIIAGVRTTASGPAAAGRAAGDDESLPL